MAWLSAARMNLLQGKPRPAPLRPPCVTFQHHRHHKHPRPVTPSEIADMGDLAREIQELTNISELEALKKRIGTDVVHLKTCMRLLAKNARHKQRREQLAAQLKSQRTADEKSRSPTPDLVAMAGKDFLKMFQHITAEMYSSSSSDDSMSSDDSDDPFDGLNIQPLHTNNKNPEHTADGLVQHPVHNPESAPVHQDSTRDMARKEQLAKRKERYAAVFRAMREEREELIDKVKPSVMPVHMRNTSAQMLAEGDGPLLNPLYGPNKCLHIGRSVGSPIARKKQ